MNNIEVQTVKQTSCWYKDATSAQWKTFFAAFMGWTLDVMDLMLYAMVIVHIMKAFNLNTADGGMLASAALVASAFGGLIFGYIADRIGRTKSMIMTILTYSIATLMCGLSQNLTQLMIFRILVGLGMGGEWSTGAALVTETWPKEHRGKIMALVQSAFAVGYAIAALIAAVVIPLYGWRAVFFAGVIPALVVFWIRRHTPESQLWNNQKVRLSFKQIISNVFGEYKRNTIICSLFTSFAMLGYWGLFTWIPTYLSTPVQAGGLGFDILKTSTWVIVMQAGAWLGFVTFGFLSDQFGRKKTFATFFICSAIAVPFYTFIRDPITLLLFGPIVAYFGTGFYSGFGPLFAELFPTTIRATAQGFIYNFGRAVSAFAPFIIGYLAVSYGLSVGLLVTSAFFVMSAVIVLVLIPETSGAELE